ncbi:MAG: type III secretion system export apparatus subunit SctR [Aquisalimonadaceae bacterium]
MDLIDLLDQLPGSGTFIVLTVVFGLGPITIIIMTSFLKMLVVMKIVRNATGLQDIPPNMALSAIALILSFYVMAPVAYDIADIMARPGVDINKVTNPETAQALADSVEPFRKFLDKHSNRRQRLFFASAARTMWADDRKVEITENDMLVLVPAFITTQLGSAFETGFLIYLPFLAIDLIVSNVLLALGMMMVSPMVVSLPFKLLLFVLADGWTRLLHGLVLSYY